jgi:hypothetical protein
MCATTQVPGTPYHDWTRNAVSLRMIASQSLYRRPHSGILRMGSLLVRMQDKDEDRNFDISLYPSQILLLWMEIFLLPLKYLCFLFLLQPTGMYRLYMKRSKGFKLPVGLMKLLA